MNNQSKYLQQYTIDDDNDDDEWVTIAQSEIVSVSKMAQ